MMVWKPRPAVCGGMAEKHACSRQSPDQRNEDVFLPPTCSVICSSSCKNMSSKSTYTPYKLFNSNLRQQIEWPEKTDVCCWYCCHRFETMPVCIPAYYSATSKIFEVFGIFCSWNCAKASVQQNYSSESSEQLMWMRIMAKKVFKTDLGDFHAAPPRIFLKMFGGHMDIESFRSKSTTSCTTILQPPLVSYPIVQQEVRGSAGEEQASPTSAESADQLASINPSMLAGKVIGLRRPASRTQRRNTSKQHSIGMYQKFVKDKETTSGEKTTQSSEKPPPKRPSAGGKGTLANYIRSRSST